jgi:RNA polymerase sigma-70 factor (ECF subfamily)
LRTRQHSAALELDAPPQAAAAPLDFGAVFAEHAGYVLGLLRRLGVAEADLEDVAQEVFIAIHAKLPGFEGRSSLKTWVCGISLRKAADHRRKRGRLREAPLEGAPELQASSGPEALATRNEEVALLMRALAALPDKQREVFVLYELEELEMAEVARAVGCPRFTAYTRLHAARRQIRAAFAAAHAEPRWRRA